MKLLIILLLSPAVFCSQRLRKSTDPNDEPFLPIHPQFPYSPKLMKRGLEQSQHHQHQPQGIPSQLSPELYAPKVESRDAYAASYGQGSASPYFSSPSSSAYDTLTKSSLSPSTLSASPYYQSSLSSLNSNPYSLLSSYGTPYGSSGAGFGLGAPGLGGPGLGAPGLGGPGLGAPGLGGPGLGVSPYAASPAAGGAPGGYPNYFYPPNPYYYPGYYGQPPYPGPPPPGYGPYKHPNDEDEDDEDDRRPKGRKSHKNKYKNSDRDNQYVDGANYIISSAKDLDSESSTHRTPSQLNQIDDSDTQTRAVVLPKATYRLIHIQPDSNSAPSGYIKVQQLEQLMRQALAKLLAQNAAQQASLAQIQQEATQLKDTPQQYISVPNTIAKTGLSYVVNPTILNRVTPGQYNPSTLIQTLGSKPYVQKSSGTSVTLQQSPGIYIPPTKSANDQGQDYGDYDSGDNVTTRPTNYQATAEPTRNSYPYSTYRPTPQTNLDDVNFGNKQKNKT